MTSDVASNANPSSIVIIIGAGPLGPRGKYTMLVCMPFPDSVRHLGSYNHWISWLVDDKEALGAGPAGHPHVSACDGLAHLASSWNYAMSCARCVSKSFEIWRDIIYSFHFADFALGGDLGCLAAAMDAVRPLHGHPWLVDGKGPRVRVQQYSLQETGRTSFACVLCRCRNLCRMPACVILNVGFFRV